MRAVRRDGGSVVRAGVILLLAAQCAAGAVSAQDAAPGAAADRLLEPGEVTLEAVVRSALATHPSLDAARARVDAAEAGVGLSRARWRPSVLSQGLVTRYEEPMVVAPLHGFDPMDPPRFERTLVQGHALVEWTAFDGGARSAGLAGARATLSSTAAALESAEDAVIAEAVSWYLAAATAREVVGAHDEEVRALEGERSRAALLFEQGKAARVEVLRAEAAASRARAARAAARERQLLAIHQLSRLTGLPEARLAAGVEPLRPGRDAPWAGSLPDRGALLAEAVGSHPEIERARGRALASAAAIRSARSAYLPTVGLTGRYSAYGSVEITPAPEWNGGVVVSWPVLTGGARARAVERAEAEARAASAEAAVIVRAVEESVDRALAALRSAAARVESLEAAVAASAEVARIEALALEAGAGVQTDYLAARAALLEVTATLAEARSAAFEARVSLARATGALTPGWIADMTERATR